jgi:hypothetical protein
MKLDCELVNLYMFPTDSISYEADKFVSLTIKRISNVEETINPIYWASAPEGHPSWVIPVESCQLGHRDIL